MDLKRFLAETERYQATLRELMQDPPVVKHPGLFNEACSDIDSHLTFLLTSLPHHALPRDTEEHVPPTVDERRRPSRMEQMEALYAACPGYVTSETLERAIPTLEGTAKEQAERWLKEVKAAGR